MGSDYNKSDTMDVGRQRYYENDHKEIDYVWFPRKALGTLFQLTSVNINSRITISFQHFLSFCWFPNLLADQRFDHCTCNLTLDKKCKTEFKEISKRSQNDPNHACTAKIVHANQVPAI